MLGITIRFAAAINKATGEDLDQDLPPPPEPYRGRTAPSQHYLRERGRRLAALSGFARTLSDKLGLGASPPSKRKPARRKHSPSQEVTA